MTSPNPALSARYGVSNSPGKKTLVRVLLALAGAVFLAVVLWVAYVFIAGNQVKENTLSYEHVSESEIAVSFSVTMPPGTAAVCGVEAFNSTRAQVGYVTVDIPPQSTAISTHRVSITTQQPAVSGAVRSCEAAR